MGKIKILSEELINKIAAGEVVERPASVVKELIENSVDAKASYIKVEVSEGGKRKIIVSDDGEGMDKEDLEICFRRHSTSKISSIDDLLHIASLGFRGEALSSIAAVSQVSMRSKTRQSIAGTEIEVIGGEGKKVSPVGMPTGTNVAVENLFFNVPARKKFLKTTETELRHIIDLVTDHSLAHPEIGFFLSHNKREIFDLPRKQNLTERIRTLLGETISLKLVPVFFDHPHLRVSGFTSKPQVSFETKYKQYIFVNSRRVRNSIIAKAVREAYGTLLPPKSNPVFLLFLSLPYEMVDVNVHPRKEEVRFVNSSFIFNSVKNSILYALQKEDLTFGRSTLDKKASPQVFGKTFAVTKKSLSRDRVPTVFEEEVKMKDISTEPFPWEKEEETKLILPSKILQVHNLYLVSQTTRGILIVDQHAAHERIIYEQLLEKFGKEKSRKESQDLLIPLTFDLSHSEASLLKENLETFNKLGFEIEEFGKNSFKVASVPNLLKDLDLISLISEVIEDLSQEKIPREEDKRSLRTISYLACRSAVKAGDRLTEQEIQDILDKLARTKTKYTCPHGRPVKVEITLPELSKLFKRT